jgi:prevent-host-death family protein
MAKSTTERVVEPDTVSISEFKARCLGLLERVRRTGQPIVVTRHGVPVAEVVPVRDQKQPGAWLGTASSTARILGDLVAPVTSPDEWEAHRS